MKAFGPWPRKGTVIDSPLIMVISKKKSPLAIQRAYENGWGEESDEVRQLYDPLFGKRCASFGRHDDVIQYTYIDQRQGISKGLGKGDVCNAWRGIA